LLGLNVNRGVEVKLRLRCAGRDHDFIPYNEVLDTMLHELCHNERGPHDEQFYKLWDELRKVRPFPAVFRSTGSRTFDNFTRQGNRDLRLMLFEGKCDASDPKSCQAD
jgi:hypothetical protein